MIFVALAFVARTAGTDVNDNVTLPGTGSQNATDLLSKRFPSQANGTNPVVLTAPKGETITASKYKKPIDDTVKAFKADPDVRSATSPLSKDGSSLLGKDKRIGYIALNLKPSPSQLTLDDAERIVALADPARDAGLEVGVGGYLGQKVSKPETHISEVVGLSMAVIVLLITFGTAVAMSIPIITAIIGLVCGLSIITLISHVADVPTTAPTLATMIGLGVGIDYALFIVTRHLEQRRDGMATDESIYRATATSGGAVVFAGCTVMIALLSLAIVGIPLVTTLGYTSALVVAVAVLGAITLLPCVLAFLGDRIDKGRIPLPHRKEDDGKSHGWHRWGESVSRHPLPAAVGATVILVALALPALGLYLGQQDNGALSKSTEARKAYDGMTTAFGAGSNGPLLDQRRHVEEAGQGRPVEHRQGQQDREGRQGQGAVAGRRQGAAAHRAVRGERHAAGRGAAAGGGRGAARPAEAARRHHEEVRRPAQEGPAPRDRPAPAGPARRHQEDEGRQERHRAARQQGRHRRGDHRDADDRTVRRGDRRPRDHAPRRRHPEGDERQGHDGVRRRHDRELRRPRERDLEPARADHPDRHRAELRAS